MYKGVLYASIDLMIYPDKAIHHLPYPPNLGRLTRVLRMCNLEIEGDGYVEGEKWVQPVKEVE